MKGARECGDEQPFSTPKSATFSKYDHALLEGSGSKKDRKEKKRAAKAAERAPLITADDIERVAHILHPKEPVNEEFEKALLMDKSIENNIFYHPGTANSYEMRDRIIRQERSGRFKLKLSEKELDQIVAELLPDMMDRSKSKKERDLIARLRKMVEEDLTHDHGEEQQTMMRKASFWRWANREAYNRLAANGRIWDWKNGEALAPVVEQQADAAGDEPKAEVLDADVLGIEAPEEKAPDEKDDTVVNESKGGGGDIHATDLLLRGLSLASEDSRNTRPSSSTSVSRNTSASSASRATGSSTDDSIDDFVTVGKGGKKLRISTTQTLPALTLKFSANGGLGHISSRSIPRTPMSAFSMLTVEDAGDSGDDDGEDEDDDVPISPRTPCPRRGIC